MKPLILKIESIVLLSLLTFGHFLVWAKTASDLPRIKYEKQQHILHLPEDMQDALRTFDRKFRPWTTGDYAPSNVEGIVKEAVPWQAPFALIMDINGDGKKDVILDGHNAEKGLLLGVVSSKRGYQVHKIWEHELWNPKDVEVHHLGVVERGFDFYLWAYEQDSRDFVIMHPIQTDQDNIPINDGGMERFEFDQGKFKSVPAGSD